MIYTYASNKQRKTGGGTKYGRCCWTYFAGSLYCYEIGEDFLSLCNESVVFQRPIFLARDPKLEVLVAVLAAQKVAEQSEAAYKLTGRNCGIKPKFHFLRHVMTRHKTLSR